MLDRDQAKRIVHAGELSKTNRLLVCLAVGDEPKSVADVREITRGIGISGAKAWNVSALLAASKGHAIRTPAGWELSARGKLSVESLAGPLLLPGPPKAATSLRSCLPAIASADTRSFVEEAVSCLERGLYRAAVVLSWVGAVSLLYSHVLSTNLSAFNAEAKKRNPKWKDAKTGDDLALMKEHDFLQILLSLSILGKSVKEQLDACLKLRNACGHPNSYHTGENRVSSHIETLTQNVFAEF